jgi:hypothetical protein
MGVARRAGFAPRSLRTHRTRRARFALRSEGTLGTGFSRISSGTPLAGWADLAPLPLETAWSHRTLRSHGTARIALLAPVPRLAFGAAGSGFALGTRGTRRTGGTPGTYLALGSPGTGFPRRTGWSLGARHGLPAGNPAFQHGYAGFQGSDQRPEPGCIVAPVRCFSRQVFLFDFFCCHRVFLMVRIAAAKCYRIMNAAPKAGPFPPRGTVRYRVAG